MVSSVSAPNMMVNRLTTFVMADRNVKLRPITTGRRELMCQTAGPKREKCPAPAVILA